MNRKGQIIAIDFIFSLLLLMLALGYVFRVAEANDYMLKEEELFRDLQRIGTAASDLLVSSPGIVCDVGMGGEDQYFMNCIKEPSLNTIDKADLGIPNGYEFGVFEGALRKSGSDPPDPAPPNIYSEARTVITAPAGLQLSQIKDCMDPATPCPAQIKTVTITLKVWKG